MVKCWYIDPTDDQINKQQELHLDPPKFVGVEDLRDKTGILYWKIDVDRIEEEGLFDKIKTDRGYSYQDLIEISREKLADFESKIEAFYKEHFHADEEIRFVLEGSGYFDVRDENDHWIRILVTRGDLIVLPTGIHHRFTLDTSNYIKVNRLFVGEPVWTALNRPNEEHEARKLYLQKLAQKFKD